MGFPVLEFWAAGSGATPISFSAVSPDPRDRLASRSRLPGIPSAAIPTPTGSSDLAARRRVCASLSGGLAGCAFHGLSFSITAPAHTGNEVSPAQVLFNKMGATVPRALRCTRRRNK